MMSEETNLRLPENRRGRKSKAFKQKYRSELKQFADTLIELDDQMKEKVSARGWCYLLEGWGLIKKGQFDYAESVINRCRKRGYLPVDFVAQDKSREFQNVERLKRSYESPADHVSFYIDDVLQCEDYVSVGFWEGQKYYIQMLVEKIDVRNLFKDVCRKYHIPIANAKGWSDILTRAELVERFKEAEEMGLTPILLYYADFDPAGLLIAEKLKKNIRDLRRATGWDPKNLIVDRFGLTLDFIKQNNLMWINNLQTGSGKKASMRYDYVREYVEKYGRKKCEANAILPIADIAINHCEDCIKKWLGDDPFKQYNKELKEKKDEVHELLEKVDFTPRLEQLKSDLYNQNNSNQECNFEKSIPGQNLDSHFSLDLETEFELILSGLESTEIISMGDLLYFENENRAAKNIKTIIKRIKKLRENL